MLFSWGVTCNVDVLDDVQDVVFVNFAILLSFKDVVDGNLLVVGWRSDAIQLPGKISGNHGHQKD